MIKVGTSTLNQFDYDKRDFLVDTVVKNLDKIKDVESFMRGISETYQQGKLGSCTAMATTHSMKIQNELEYNRNIFLDWKHLRANMGHSTTKYDGGDSLDNAIKTALKFGIDGLLDGKVVNFKADCYAYGLRENWRRALQLFPLITVIKGNANTWKEMILGEVKTVGKFRDGHAVVIAGYDNNYVYFYNSFGDAVTKNGISNFRVTRPNFDAMIKNGMINWRYFTLIDKKELKDYAVEIELSKQILAPAKKLYELGDKETKEYFQKIGLGKYLETKYSFKY